MQRVFRNLRGPDWLTFLSAVLIVFAFPPWNLTHLIWFALVPWFYAIARARGPKECFFQGVWLSFFMGMGGFYWVASAIHEYGNLPWALSIIGLVLFCFGGQPQLLIFAPLLRNTQSHLQKGRALGITLLLGLVYAGIDWIVPKLFHDTFGHAFYASPHISQIADIGGAHLLTFLVFVVNYCLWGTCCRILFRQEPSLWPSVKAALPQLGLALGLVAATWGYGSVRLSELKAAIEHPLRTIQMAALQGNIGDFEKIASERGVRGAAHKVIDSYFALSDQALEMKPKPEVLIWPETSYPSTFRTPQTTDELYRDQKVEHFVRDRGVPLLFGGYDTLQGKDFNAFFFLSPKGQPNLAGAGDLQVYRKNILLLFGEFIPGAEMFPIIKETFPQVGNFGRGVGAEVLKIPPVDPKQEPVRAGPIICYEALFPNYILAAANKGSQLILNITNDSWFGPLGEPHLHLALTVFRSLESRLPQLRVTNTGISALILPTGRIAQRTKIGVPEILNATVPIIAPVPTLMRAWGDWFGPVALGVGVMGLGLMFLRPGRGRAGARAAAKKR